jgi:serine/threonine protein kinase
MLAARADPAHIDRYTILRTLAMGGMAEILLARVLGPERLVVLKRMHRQLAADREYVQMFLHEARIAMTLRHPNIVEVYEIGEDNDQYYIVMEHLHGHDLRHVLSEMATRQVPMRLGQALAITRGMCHGLDYTHKRTDADGVLLGIVHRDVSPHNVVLTFSGRVKLVDFGIAKASTQSSKTLTGIVKGKVAYMSPEQAMGEPLDHRSDVFCIGILLWEMTTGRRLYRRKSELETLKAVVESDAPRPSQVIPAYPPELERIVMKTLARSRDERWATAGELDEALDEFAKRRRFDLSAASLATLMSTTFREQYTAWQDARRAGSSLGDHLLAEYDREERTREPHDVPRFGDSDPDYEELEDLPTTVVMPSRGPVSARTSALKQVDEPTSRLSRALHSRTMLWVAAAIAGLSLIALLVAIITTLEEVPVPRQAPTPPASTTGPGSTVRPSSRSTGLVPTDPNAEPPLPTVRAAAPRASELSPPAAALPPTTAPGQVAPSVRREAAPGSR